MWYQHIFLETKPNKYKKSSAYILMPVDSKRKRLIARDIFWSKKEETGAITWHTEKVKSILATSIFRSIHYSCDDLKSVEYSVVHA